MRVPDHQVGRDRTQAEIRAIFDACPKGHIAVLHYSPPIPATPIAFRSDLPASLKARIKEALLSTPGDAEFIRAARRWYVDPSKERGLANLDAYYNSVREIAKLLDRELASHPKVVHSGPKGEGGRPTAIARRARPSGASLLFRVPTTRRTQSALRRRAR